LTAQLQSSDHSVCGQTVISGKVGKNWTKLSVAIKATGNANKGRFVLLSSAKGILDMDVVSLFPYTWKKPSEWLAFRSGTTFSRYSS
jgi:hypothetical protein